MSRGIAYIREWYNVPATRGAVVKTADTKEKGVILNGKGGNYLSVRVGNEVRKYHPFDLNYKIEEHGLPASEVFIKGSAYKEAHDRRIEKRNEQFANAKALLDADNDVGELSSLVERSRELIDLQLSSEQIIVFAMDRYGEDTPIMDALRQIDNEIESERNLIKQKLTLYRKDKS